jgi:hypothetical protein
MTKAYHHAQAIIKKHVNAAASDVLVTTGFGMTAAAGQVPAYPDLKTCGRKQRYDCIPESERPCGLSPTWSIIPIRLPGTIQ